MTEVTDAMLEEIERLQEPDQLIALPWKYHFLEIIGADGIAVCEISSYGSRSEMSLIEAACNAAPAIVAEIRRLRHRVNELEEAAKSEFQRGYTMGKDS